MRSCDEFVALKLHEVSRQREVSVAAPIMRLFTCDPVWQSLAPETKEVDTDVHTLEIWSRADRSPKQSAQTVSEKLKRGELICSPLQHVSRKSRG